MELIFSTENRLIISIIIFSIAVLTATIIFLLTSKNKDSQPVKEKTSLLNLGVWSGFKFGFGFGAGLFLWGLFISSIFLLFVMKILTEALQQSFGGTLPF